MAANIDINIGRRNVGGGSVNTGVLQIQGGVALDSTLRAVTDQAGTLSPLQLSTTQVYVNQGNFGTYWNYGAAGDELFTFGGTNNWRLDRAGNSEMALRIRRARGTLSSPTAVQSGDLLMEFGTDGYGASQYNRAFNIVVTATENFTNSTWGTAVRFEKSRNGVGTRQTVMGFDQNNNVGVGFPTLVDASYNARLTVRGDGTLPIYSTESNAGVRGFFVTANGAASWGSAAANTPYIVNWDGSSTEFGAGTSLRIRQTANTGAAGNTLMQYWADGLFNGTTTGTAISHHFRSSGFAGAAGSANYRNIQIEYTINNSGAQSGIATGIFLNATETNLNGMTHNLMDLQAGGTTRFRVRSVSGGVRVNINGLPTSAAGLSAGDLWNNAGVINIA